MEEEKRRWGDRRDARWIREMDGLHAMFPYLMDRRADAEVYINLEIDVTETLRYLAQRNQEPGTHITIFHCFLMAVAKTIYLRPALNRFVAGRRYYQRRQITLGFVAKRRFEDHSEESLIVAEAPEDWTLSAVVRRVSGEVGKVRAGKSQGLDNALDFLKKVPRPLMLLFMGLIRLLDFYGRVPRALTEGDTNYATVLLTNLGSIRCPSVYHHLNNYGTNSLIVAIGAIHKAEVLSPAGEKQVRDVVDLGVTVDERIADGFYFARSLKIIEYLLAHPALLERPLKEEIDFVC